MRTLLPHIDRKDFIDESGISSAILLAKGDMVGEVTNNQLDDMVEGESRIDLVNARKVTKANGKLYKQIVDENSEVRIIEL